MAYHHCVSRVVNRTLVLGDEEREVFVGWMLANNLSVPGFCSGGRRFAKRHSIKLTDGLMLRLPVVLYRCHFGLREIDDLNGHRWFPLGAHVARRPNDLKLSARRSWRGPCMDGGRRRFEGRRGRDNDPG